MPPTGAFSATPDEALIRAVVRAHRWKRLLEQKKYQSVSELAEAEGLTRSFFNRLLRLTLLAPDIIEAILDGRHPKEMQLEDVTRAMQITWNEQRQRLLANWRRTSRQRNPTAHQPTLLWRADRGDVRDGGKASTASSRDSP